MLTRRMMAFWALMEADLVNSIARSWAVRGWLGLMTLQAIITVPSSTGDATAADALAGLLGTFPLIWSLFIIVNTSGAVSSESGVVADSILSKSVTRYEYILAKTASRLVMVIGAYLLVTLPSAYLIYRYGSGDLATDGVVWGVVLVGMMLLLLTVLAVALSTLFNRTMVAMIGTWGVWYAAGAIAALFQVEYLSPLDIVDALPATLVGDYAAADQWRILIGFAAVSAAVMGIAVWHFSRKDL
jgi:ABC-2 type transport system permease protein